MKTADDDLGRLPSRWRRTVPALLTAAVLLSAGTPLAFAQEGAGETISAPASTGEPSPAADTSSDTAAGAAPAPRHTPTREPVTAPAPAAPAPAAPDSAEGTGDDKSGDKSDAKPGDKPEDKPADDGRPKPPGSPAPGTDQQSQATDGTAGIPGAAPARRARSLAAAPTPAWISPKPAANPAMPEKCGLNIALVFDVSNSINTDGLEQSKRSAKAVVDGLAGTPTTVGLFNFATNAPGVPAATQVEPISVADRGGVDALKSRIDGLSIPGYPVGGTNWEGGLAQVPAGTYDVVYFITDGLPTTNESRTGGDYGSITHANDLNDAIAAANRLKASGTRIVPVTVKMPSSATAVLRPGIDNFANPPGGYAANKLYFAYDTAAGVHYIGRYEYDYDYGTWFLNRHYWDESSQSWRTYDSRPDLWSVGSRTASDMAADISQPGAAIGVASYDGLVEALRKTILGPCRSTLNVVKTIVDADGRTIEDGVVEGWDFTAEGTGAVLENPPHANEKKQTKTTDDRGSVTFGIDSQQAQRFTVTERQQPGFTLYRRDGKNARCVSSATNGTRQANVEVTNAGADGFRVTVPNDGPLLGTVTCWVDNMRVPSATIRKEPISGEPVKVNPDGTASLTYTVTVANPAPNAKAEGTEPFDVVRLPEGVIADGDATVAFPATDGVTVAGGITGIPKADLVPDKRIRLADRIELGAGKTQTITVTIPVKVTGTGAETWERLGRCDGDGGAVSATGVPNSVEMAGDDDAPDNNACIPLLPPDTATVSIAKVDKDDNDSPLDGATFRLYASAPDGSIDWDRPVTDEGAGNADLGKNLVAGTYHLVETKAPSGYTLLSQPVAIVVDAHGNGYTASLGDPNDAALVSVGPENEPSYRLVVKVADVKTGTLPKTGGPGIGAALAIGAAIIGAGALLGSSVGQGIRRGRR
ncbi:SpaA isopeptide-forming pilin-related protein [Corynebacterium sp. NPDC060344]|uniref:SpaA isopeptide-forming pilin-related protein n=1 Tax=Corynebacterium sp. NPDC060344 TaxID=3347101 RepID=UPI00365352F5